MIKISLQSFEINFKMSCSIQIISDCYVTQLIFFISPPVNGKRTNVTIFKKLKCVFELGFSLFNIITTARTTKAPTLRIKLRHTAA